LTSFGASLGHFMNGCSLPITLICQLRTASEGGSAGLVSLSLAADEPAFAATEVVAGAEAEAAAGAEGSLLAHPAIKSPATT
jgi:hypothetical protein